MDARRVPLPSTGSNGPPEMPDTRPPPRWRTAGTRGGRTSLVGVKAPASSSGLSAMAGPPNVPLDAAPVAAAAVPRCGPADRGARVGAEVVLA